MVVGIVKADYKTIDDDLRKLFELIKYKPEKDKVFIKPNIVDALPPSSAVIVHYKLIDALFSYLKDNGVKEIIIGEGTGFFNKPEHFERLIKETKYNKIEKKYGIKILNLEYEERIKLNWKYGKINLPKIVFDPEVEYINVAKMKTHTMATVTLTAKNQKGLLSLADKRRFHKEDLHGMIRELAKIVSPRLAMIDGIIALEGSGPTENPQTNVKKPGILLGCLGNDCLFEIDNVATEIMGIPIDKIKHLPKVKYQTLGESIESVKMNFEMPKKYVKYGKVVHYQNEKTCTLCQMAFSQTMRKINFKQEIREQFEAKIQKYKWIDIIQGSGWEKLPENCIKPILIGNCTKELAEKLGIEYCKGCPPHYNDIVDFILKSL